MSLFINQGKQDTSNDKSYEIMISANETAQITKIEMDKNWADTLNITFKVISEGKFKGRLFWDRVAFKGDFSWKYRNLRKAAGVPYTDGEDLQIDIEALLLNKAVNVELSARKGNDGNDYQSVKYKTTTVQTPVETAAIEDAAVEVDVTADEEVPW